MKTESCLFTATVLRKEKGTQKSTQKSTQKGAQESSQENERRIHEIVNAVCAESPVRIRDAVRLESGTEMRDAPRHKSRPFKFVTQCVVN